MPENDFEKQVQQKMSELRFVPSAVAWERVEKQIADKKKRRRVLIWLPLLFLFLAGTGWFYTNRSTGVREKGATAVREKDIALQEKTDSNVVANNNAPLPGTKSGSLLNVIKQDRELNLKEKDGIASTTGKKQIHPTVVLLLNKQTPIQQGVAANIYNHHTTAPEKNVEKKVEFFRESSVHDKEQKNGQGNEDVSGNSSLTNKPTEEVTKPGDSLSGTTSVILQAPDDPGIAGKEPADSAKEMQRHNVQNIATSKNLKNSKQHLEWGFSFGGGSSQISAGFPGIVTTRMDALSYSSFPQNNGGNLNNGSINYTGPSAVNSHFAWSAAVLVRKSIGLTWKLNTGISYYNYATGILLGGKIADTTGANRIVYRNGRSANCTNHMHFIEVPLTIDKQLGMRSRFSVNAGLGFAVLAGTNQVRFDQQANLYYTDKSIINKTQWTLLLGLNYRVLQKKIHLETGPVLNYHLANAFNKDIYANGHWVFAGIRASIFFDKGKK